MSEVLTAEVPQTMCGGETCLAVLSILSMHVGEASLPETTEQAATPIFLLVDLVGHQRKTFLETITFR